MLPVMDGVDNHICIEQNVKTSLLKNIFVEINNSNIPSVARLAHLPPPLLVLRLAGLPPLRPHHHLRPPP